MCTNCKGLSVGDIVLLDQAGGLFQDSVDLVGRWLNKRGTDSFKVTKVACAAKDKWKDSFIELDGVQHSFIVDRFVRINADYDVNSLLKGI